jgi:hypothetical protein
MSRVLDRAAFVAWFDKFMPAPYSAKFSPLRSVNLDAVGRGGGGRGRGSAQASGANPDPNGTPVPSPRATWTGLALTRAQAYHRLAAALPPSDDRVAAFKRLAAIHAEIAQKGLADPAASEMPWLGTFAVSYLSTMGSTR